MKNIRAFQTKALSIGIISIMLSACGEGSDTPPPIVNPPVTTPGTSIPATPLEPSTPIK